MPFVHIHSLLSRYSLPILVTLVITLVNAEGVVAQDVGSSPPPANAASAVDAATRWAETTRPPGNSAAWIANENTFSDTPGWSTDGFYGGAGVGWAGWYGPLGEFVELSYPLDADTMETGNSSAVSGGLDLHAGYTRRLFGFATNWHLGFGRVRQYTGVLSFILEPWRDNAQMAIDYVLPMLRIGAGWTWWSFDGETRAAVSSFQTPTVELEFAVRALRVFDAGIGARLHYLTDQQLGPGQAAGVSTQVTLRLSLHIDPGLWEAI